jgi:outer membrane autotransporter protein
VSARASSANIDTAYLAAYAGTGFGAWNFRSGATFAWNTIGTSRAVIFPGFSEQASTRYGAGESQVFGELGYGMTFGGIAAEPFAGLAWVHLDTRGFTETGGVSALTGTGNKDDIGYSTLGLRAATYYYQPSQQLTHGCPVTLSNGHDLPGLVDQRIPGIAAVVDDIVERFEDAV